MAFAQIYEEIRCERTISYGDVDRVRRRYELTVDHGKILDEALKVVKYSNIKVLKNAEIQCVAKNMLIMFYSGNRRNKFIAWVDSSGKPVHKCIACSVFDRMNARHVVIGMILGALVGLSLGVFQNTLPTYVRYDDLRDACTTVQNQNMGSQDVEAAIRHLLSIIDHRIAKQTVALFARCAFNAVGASVVGGIVGVFIFKFF